MRILTICNDYYHSGEMYENVIREIISDADLTFIYNIEKENLEVDFSSYELMILARSYYVKDSRINTWMSKEFKKKFIAYIESGGRLLVLHSGIVGYGKQKDLSKIFGGYFDFHPLQTNIVYSIQKNNELNLKTRTFIKTDEHYHIVITSNYIDVFALGKSCYGTQPAGWINTEYGMKVCILTMGHTVDIIESKEYKELLTAAYIWCMK